jgi:hypothetical protein
MTMPRNARSCRSLPQFVFVGERPSPRARQMRVTWQDGRLAAKPLHTALRACGIPPETQRYLNLFRTYGPLTVKQTALRRLQRWVRAGRTIVALGRRVAQALDAAGIPHLQLVHPAARGRIRNTDRYCAHVHATLSVVLAIPPRQERPPAATRERLREADASLAGTHPVSRDPYTGG